MLDRILEIALGLIIGFQILILLAIVKLALKKLLRKLN